MVVVLLLSRNCSNFNSEGVLKTILVISFFLGRTKANYVYSFLSVIEFSTKFFVKVGGKWKAGSKGWCLVNLISHKMYRVW